MFLQMIYCYFIDTRETAVVDSLLAATASIEVAAACRNEELLGCTCKIDGINGQDENGNFITYGCAHDTAKSAEILQNFLDCSDASSMSDAVRNHNYDAGFEVSCVRFLELNFNFFLLDYKRNTSKLPLYWVLWILLCSKLLQQESRH